MTVTPTRPQIESETMKVFRQNGVRIALKTWIPNFVALGFLSWALWPITDSALQGDDIPNSMRSAVLSYFSQSRWSAIEQSVSQWLKNEGRFFPISAIENVYLFSTIHSVALYKVVQWLTAVTVIAVVAWLATSIIGARRTLPVVLLAIGAGMQTRNWYDPTFGFGLLLQSTLLKVVVAAILLHRVVTRKSSGFVLTGSVILWTLALLQYEVVITLLPIFAIVAFVALDVNRIKNLLYVIPHSVVAITFLIMSQIMRGGRTPAPAYTTNTNLRIFGPTYLKQVSGGVPFSQHFWGSSTENFFGSIYRPEVIIVLVIVVVVMTMVSPGLASSSFDYAKVIGLFLIGLNMALGPGLPTAMSQRWQSELSWGYGYLPVYFQYFGVGLVLFSAIVLAFSIGRKHPHLGRLTVAGLMSILVLSLASNMQNMRSNVAAQAGQKNGRELYESAVRNGMLNGIPDGSIIYSAEADPNSWINEYFTAWLGGPRGLLFVRNDQELRDACTTSNCSSRMQFELRSYADSLGQPWITLRDRPFGVTGETGTRLSTIMSVAGTQNALLKFGGCKKRDSTSLGKKYAFILCQHV